MSKTETRYVDFRAVKAAVSMEQVLQHYGALDHFKRGHDSLSGPCPIHLGTNPTQFRVSLSKNCWNCFGDCQGGGNVLDFVARMENVPTMEAANRIVDWFHLDRATLNAGSSRATRERPPQRDRYTSVTSTPPAAAAETPMAASAREASPPAAAPQPNEDGGANRALGFKLELDATHPYLRQPCARAAS